MSDPSTAELPRPLVSPGKIAFVIGYLLVSTLAAAIMVWPGLPAAADWLTGLALLALFLLLARLFVRWVMSLDEFLQLLAFRAMAIAGMVTVWFILAVGFVFDQFGNDHLWIIVAIGPPQYWLCVILFLHQLERSHLRES